MWKAFLVLMAVSCGQSETSDIDIVGSNQSVYRSWYGRMELNGRFRCGSTLIHKRWAMTARHCLPGSSKNLKVRFGAYKNGGNNGGRPFDLVRVQQMVSHPQYDLALLRLARPVKFKPIKISNGRNIEPGKRLQAFGFGATSFNGGSPGKLLGVTLRAVRGRGASHMIYTDGSQGKGVCFGDSGGPLLDPGRREVVGAASWTGSQCASRGGHDGFVRPDMDWIKHYIQL